MADGKLVGFIAHYPVSRERFYLLNPTDCTSPQDARERLLVISGYSPNRRRTVKAYFDLSELRAG